MNYIEICDCKIFYLLFTIYAIFVIYIEKNIDIVWIFSFFLAFYTIFNPEKI